MAKINGVITDGTSGAPAACTVHVLSSNGSFIHPDGAVVRRWDLSSGVGTEVIRERLTAATDGWIAARCYSHVRDSYGQEILPILARFIYGAAVLIRQPSLTLFTSSTASTSL